MMMDRRGLQFNVSFEPRWGFGISHIHKAFALSEVREGVGMINACTNVIPCDGCRTKGTLIPTVAKNARDTQKHMYGSRRYFSLRLQLDEQRLFSLLPYLLAQGKISQECDNETKTFRTFRTHCEYSEISVGTPNTHLKVSGHTKAHC